MRSSASPTPSTASSAASSRRRRTTCGDVRRVRLRPCAGKTMSARFEPRLPFEEEPATIAIVSDVPAPRAAGGALADADARRAAVDPAQNVVLEASAGTGKTRVLVERYVNLLRAGVDPDHILAITFTRKAAAEMRERIIERLREASRQSEFDRGRWRERKDRLADIA